METNQDDPDSTNELHSSHVWPPEPDEAKTETSCRPSTTIPIRCSKSRATDTACNSG